MKFTSGFDLGVAGEIELEIDVDLDDVLTKVRGYLTDTEIFEYLEAVDTIPILSHLSDDDIVEALVDRDLEMALGKVMGTVSREMLLDSLDMDDLVEYMNKRLD